ncbi:MAG: DNA repair protein RadA [Candidatus Levybacteria bacterium RIFCSPHIGHO2_02_FULL_39_36]|uniref:DNA repair protein RadA n=1 Tax=Candidatus Woesebacteria bacterium GW2011_GWA1_41_13b TaxID=1618555 RepID=A0A0G0USS2_9BACT|nr:MAG: repair protein radA protein [Candidatus Woesebacteria bacterium GW2011_GWA1_41_13b]OGH27902.1 MAG: DNA repair protein RadA [Candidatus Levybacteria bacterium RIFCSPHIGHO2_02_FULL_39_36]OGH36217.1 MAG: DNA repair protein RadA [Candidatus Levybacteria bacterium RIFCSPLOWO2_01_FULL_38_120]OGH45538.1 MAG: DNA repair protein RadA [Candidatus Levybacteria bacterium RIFCSPLOWO2_02_FULL_39_26]OGH47985.1 MAG: DNA repair protein RadA [Candidatus Levybacteria bacterium RIFCSPLOWO2_12_FULL_39_17]
MAVKTAFICSNCGYESGKWYGRCPDCSSWNTLQEVIVQKISKNANIIDLGTSAAPLRISEVKTSNFRRISTGFLEFDRVLGGRDESCGIVPGSVILLSGDPGVGKSTLILEVALNIAGSSWRLAGRNLKNQEPKPKRQVLYITGEESENQIKLRAERIGKNKDMENLFIFSTGDIDLAIASCEKIAPDIVIVDSIQTMSSQSFPGFAGSLPQVRHATSRLVSYAKKKGTPIFIVGHVTKEGVVAGPMLLSHMVDCVLYFEGENLTGTRILRAFKNRFGDTSEVGIFNMEENGFSEVDTSKFFMDQGNLKVPGSCLTVLMEGARPIIVEIQGLVVPSNLSFPRRVSNGFSSSRLELLLAVIQKHLKLPFERIDVFLNVVGGLRITETAADLAVCMACISSFKNKPLGSIIAVGEVGLLGEIKDVLNLKLRLKEAKKLGFKRIISNENYKFLNDIIRAI